MNTPCLKSPVLIFCPSFLPRCVPSPQVLPSWLGTSHDSFTARHPEMPSECPAINGSSLNFVAIETTYKEALSTLIKCKPLGLLTQGQYGFIAAGQGLLPWQCCGTATTCTGSAGPWPLHILPRALSSAEKPQLAPDEVLAKYPETTP